MAKATDQSIFFTVVFQAIPKGALPGALRCCFVLIFHAFPQPSTWDAQEAWEGGTHLQCSRACYSCRVSFWGFVFVLDWSKDKGCVLPSHLSFAPNHVYFPFQKKARDSLWVSGEGQERLQFTVGRKLFAWSR